MYMVINKKSDFCINIKLIKYKKDFLIKNFPKKKNLKKYCKFTYFVLFLQNI